MSRAASGAGSIGALLGEAQAALAGIGATPRLDAEVLLAHAAGIARSTMLAFPERSLSADATAAFDALVARRARNEPLAYIIGGKEFYSLPFEVTPAVLVPRPETETLVDVALERAARGARLLDLGTGSGAIAIAVKHARPDLDVTATDKSAAALAVARRNAERLGAVVRFLHSDWCTGLGTERFDVIVSNPPYVPTADAARDALRFEPALALDGGPDGLNAIRALVASAAPHLARGGLLAIEHGYDQHARVAAIGAAAGLALDGVRRDLAGHERVTLLALRAADGA